MILHDRGVKIARFENRDTASSEIAILESERSVAERTATRFELFRVSLAIFASRKQVPRAGNSSSGLSPDGFRGFFRVSNVARDCCALGSRLRCLHDSRLFLRAHD